MQKTCSPGNESQRREQFGAGSNNSGFGASIAICHTLEYCFQLPPNTGALYHWDGWEQKIDCPLFAGHLHGSSGGFALQFECRPKVTNKSTFMFPTQGGCKWPYSVSVDMGFPWGWMQGLPGEALSYIPQIPSRHQLPSVWWNIEPFLEGMQFCEPHGMWQYETELKLIGSCAQPSSRASSVGVLGLEAEGLGHRWQLPKYHSRVACMLY